MNNNILNSSHCHRDCGDGWADVTQTGEMWGGEPLYTEEAVEDFGMQTQSDKKQEGVAGKFCLLCAFKANQRRRKASLICGKS